MTIISMPNFIKNYDFDGYFTYFSALSFFPTFKATFTIDDRRLPKAIPVGSIDGSIREPRLAISGIIALRPGFGLAVLRVRFGLAAIRKFEFLRRLLSKNEGSGANADPRRPI